MVDRGIVKKDKVVRKRELYGEDDDNDELNEEEADWANEPDIQDFLEREDSYESDDSDELFTVAGMTNDKEQSFNEFQKKQDEFDEADLDKDGVVTDEEKREFYETTDWKNAHNGNPYFTHPWFDWQKKERWINDRDAINYWLNVKGGNRTALTEYKSEYPTNFDSKTY
jgi:hypothetical protein